MELTPFTLEEATDIAEDFEDLVDTDFELDRVVYEVIDVLVCPYNEEDGKKFMDSYVVTKDKEASLNFYMGGEFEVIVFASNINDPNQNTFIDIRSFTEQRGIQYNYPGKL